MTGQNPLLPDPSPAVIERALAAEVARSIRENAGRMRDQITGMRVSPGFTVIMRYSPSMWLPRSTSRTLPSWP